MACSFLNFVELLSELTNGSLTCGPSFGFFPSCLFVVCFVVCFPCMLVQFQGFSFCFIYYILFNCVIIPKKTLFSNETEGVCIWMEGRCRGGDRIRRRGNYKPETILHERKCLANIGGER